MSTQVTSFSPPTTALGWLYCLSQFLLLFFFFSCKNLSKPMWSHSHSCILNDGHQWNFISSRCCSSKKKDPGFAVTNLVLEIPFRAERPAASACSLASSNATVESRATSLLLSPCYRTESVDVPASALAQHFGEPNILPIGPYLERRRRRRWWRQSLAGSDPPGQSLIHNYNHMYKHQGYL